MMYQTPTPPMGWNSWNCGIELTQQSVKQTIDAMVSSGMRDAGYRYVVLDAGWAGPSRDSGGRLTADPVRFPRGIAPLSRYAHDRGLLFGLYSSPYNEICGQGRSTASAGHEVADAAALAAWDVDFLKYDWCRVHADHRDQVRMFNAMRDALHATGRAIVYSINPNSSSDETAGSTYNWSGIADMVRIGGDVVPVWDNAFAPDVVGAPAGAPPIFLGLAEAFASAQARRSNHDDGYWEDPDMLVVGVTWREFVLSHLTALRDATPAEALARDGEQTLAPMLSMTDDEMHQIASVQPALTENEQRAQFSLWAMLSAPLMAGNDLRKMSEQTRAILTNAEVIAVDQDPLGEPAIPLPSDNRIWLKSLSDGATAVAFFNPAEHAATFIRSTASLGIPASKQYRVRDLWRHVDLMASPELSVLSVPPHGVTLVRIAPA